MPIANHMVGLRSFIIEKDDEHKRISQSAADTFLKVTALLVGFAISFLIARIAMLLNGNTGGDMAIDTVFKLTQPLITPLKAMFGLRSNSLTSLGGEILFCLTALAVIAAAGWALVMLLDSLVSGSYSKAIKREEYN